MPGKFLHMALLLLFFFGPGFAQGAKPTAKSSGSSSKPAEHRYTREVRRVTGGLKVDRRRWKMIICHHSGIRHGNAASYDQEHRRRGIENGLAYHFVIGNGVDSGDGEVEVGARWLKQLPGGHVRSEELNWQAIGICLVGNLNQQKPTPKQVAALLELVTYLRKELLGKKVRVTGHKHVDPGHTACPGRHFAVKKLQRLYGRF